MFKPMLVQVPLFISVFSGLREIANLPVESFKTGGALWFTNLTISDPYYVLPIISMISLIAVMEISFSQQNSYGSQKNKNIQNIMRILPLAGILFTMRMPSALLLYWSASNVISLGQTSLLRVTAVKRFFKIPDIKPQKIDSLKPTENKGFIDGLKSSMANSRVLAEVDMRRKTQFDQFKKAGEAKVQKTRLIKKDNPNSVASGGNLTFPEDIDKIK